MKLIKIKYNLVLKIFIINFCIGFSNTIFAFEPNTFDPENYQAIIEHCRFLENNDSDFFAIRKFSSTNMNLKLIVDASNLQTQIVEDKVLNCKTISKSEFISNGSVYQNFLYHLSESPVNPKNAGLAMGKNISQGSFLTIDLCPTDKPLVRSLFDQFTASEKNPVNVNISISGYWLKKHTDDFHWLLNEQSSKHLNITWVNHSYSHPYIKNLKSSENFFFLPNVDIENEIFKTEILLLQNGIVPTVFFRFPGLVANEKLVQLTSAYGLISLGSDSWLNIGGRPKTGSFILVHGNGNELGGLTILSNLYKKNKIPFPLLSLFELQASRF